MCDNWGNYFSDIVYTRKWAQNVLTPPEGTEKVHIYVHVHVDMAVAIFIMGMVKILNDYDRVDVRRIVTVVTDMFSSPVNLILVLHNPEGSLILFILLEF